MGEKRVGRPKSPPPMTLEEEKRKLSEIPPDTRTYTARVMGDPLPHRSALALKGKLA